MGKRLLITIVSGVLGIAVIGAAVPLGAAMLLGWVAIGQFKDDKVPAAVKAMEKGDGDALARARALVESNARLTVADRDRLFVAWQDNRLGNNDVFFTTSFDGGATFAPAASLASPR